MPKESPDAVIPHMDHFLPPVISSPVPCSSPLQSKCPVLNHDCYDKAVPRANLNRHPTSRLNFCNETNTHKANRKNIKTPFIDHIPMYNYLYTILGETRPIHKERDQ